MQALESPFSVRASKFPEGLLHTFIFRKQVEEREIHPIQCLQLIGGLSAVHQAPESPSQQWFEGESIDGAHGTLLLHPGSAGKCCKSDQMDSRSTSARAYLSN